MSLPSSHILPASNFRHIGFMVLFMSVMASFCAMGFVSVQDITHGWLSDVDNTLSLEIPAYDDKAKTIYSSEQISDHLKNIQSILKNDPIIQRVNIVKPDGLMIESTAIPAPIFVTLTLRPERANNAEQRIINRIKKDTPNIVIKTADTWEYDIQKTAFTLKLIFGGLALSVFIITSIILSAVIRTQIKANKHVIELIHLMGAPTSKIVRLFQSAIIRPTLWGCIIGIIIALLSLSPLMMLLGLGTHMTAFYYSLLGIFVTFVTLNLIMIFITVTSTLRSYP